MVYFNCLLHNWNMSEESIACIPLNIDSFFCRMGMVNLTINKMSGSVTVDSGALIGCDCWRSLQREDLGNIESDFSLDANTNRNFSFNCTPIEHNINWTMFNSMRNIKILCCTDKAGRTIHRHFDINGLEGLVRLFKIHVQWFLKN